MALIDDIRALPQEVLDTRDTAQIAAALPVIVSVRLAAGLTIRRLLFFWSQPMKKFLFRSFVASLMLAVAAIAHAGALTDYAENKLVDALIRGQAIGAPATWYVAVTGAAADIRVHASWVDLSGTTATFFSGELTIMEK